MVFTLNDRELQNFFAQGDNEVYAFNLLINENYSVDKVDKEKFANLYAEVKNSFDSSIYITSSALGSLSFLWAVRRVKQFSCPYLTAGCTVVAFFFPPFLLRSLNKQYYARNFRLMRDISRKYDWRNDTNALRKLGRILTPIK